jgi:hypothetical protein
MPSLHTSHAEWPNPPVIDSESEVEEDISREGDNDGGKRWLQVRSVLVQDYMYILTFSAGKVSTSLDNNARYESGDSNANGGDEDHGREVRIH